MYILIHIYYIYIYINTYLYINTYIYIRARTGSRRWKECPGVWIEAFPLCAKAVWHAVSGINIRQHMSYVSIRQHTSWDRAGSVVRQGSVTSCIRNQHTSAYVSIREHTCACVHLANAADKTHAWAYVSIREHTWAYVSIRVHTCAYSKRSRQDTLVC
jgi:hypothetical protein